MAMWRCGDVAMWRCGDVAMWRCGDVAMWRCGDVAMWRCGASGRGRADVWLFMVMCKTYPSHISPLTSLISTSHHVCQKGVSSNLA